MTEYTYYRTPDASIYRIAIVPDPDAESPRENDNATVIHTFDSHWLSPDREQDRQGHSTGPVPLIPSDYIYDGRVDMRRARRWVALFGQNPDVGVLAIEGVERIQGGWAEGGLRITRGDDRANGYVAITRESWETCMGDSPLEGGNLLANPEHGTPSAADVMAQDVAEYSRWAAGEYVGFTIERAVIYVPAGASDGLGEYEYDPDDEVVIWVDVSDGSCWGIDDEDYAKAEAISRLPDGAVQITEAELSKDALA